MTKYFAYGLLALCGVFASQPASAQEITIEVNPDDSVHIVQGHEYEQVNGGSDGTLDSTDVSRMTVLFPQQKPAVYELESEEDYVLIVDGWLPDGADILLEATSAGTAEAVDDFEHTIRGGDWLIDAKYLNKLPPGEVTLTATLRTPGRRDARVSHPFYILEPGDIGEDQDTDWFDWELEDNENAAPFVPGEGFMVFEPPADARIYYVSATGNDNATGVSQNQPLRTLRAAYEKVRDDSGDWILLKAGDTFDGGFGVWSKSGKSADQPLYVGVYGDGDRPIVHTNGENFWRGYGTVSNIAIDGIHAYANARLGKSGEDLVWRESGMAHFGNGRNFVVHDSKFEGFRFNLVFQGYEEGSIRNVVLYRCIVNNSFGHWDGSIGGHSSGLYAQSITGLRIIECTFDRNGWNPQVHGAARTKFNHNMYIQYNCSDVSVERTLVTRGASHGLQLRSGGDVIDSTFARNAMGFYVTREPSIVADNVVMESTDINDREIRGHGFSIFPVEEALVTNNIVTRKVGRAGWLLAIEVGWTKALSEIDSFDVTLRDNVVWDWYMDHRASPIGVNGSANTTRYNNAIDGIGKENNASVVYNDPYVDFDRYHEGGLSEFLRQAVQRRRGEWQDKFTAPAFNAYMRSGFSPAGSSGNL
ncbi:MAG: hypothetical protein AAGG38_09110 [Planctomycetota bacterium]